MVKLTEIEKDGQSEPFAEPVFKFFFGGQYAVANAPITISLILRGGAQEIPLNEGDEISIPILDMGEVFGIISRITRGMETRVEIFSTTRTLGVN